MIGLTVSVEFHDFLEHSLPWNAPQFDEILVVSSHADHQTRAIVDRQPNAHVYTTNAFYRKGSMFNKGWAIDEALDSLNTDSWVCYFDADTLIPREVDFADYDLYPGQIHMAQRRLCPSLGEWDDRSCWDDWPLSKELLGVAGYFLLFHMQDPVLAQRPWYPRDWTDAGGSDTEFIAKWEPSCRRWFPWYCLHVGELKQNWCGRIVPYPNGHLPHEHGPRNRRMLTLAQNIRECGESLRKLKGVL